MSVSAFLDYSGMRFEDFKQVGWKAFVHPDDFPQTAKAYYQAIQSGNSYRGVFRLRRADGEFRWHHARCEPLRDRQGRIIQWYGLSVDIDEAQLQAILNVLPAYTWYAAPRGALTFVNTQTAEYLGIPNDHPLRFGIDVGAEWDHSFALLHPDDREDAQKYWSSRLRTGEGGEHSYRVRSAQGDYRWFLTRMEPLRASDGTLLLWIGATLDIEQLKCAEQALRESEGKFRDYAESASDWFWEIGPDYKFTLLTENAFGSNAADQIGTACWDRALDLETEPEKWRLLRATLESRKPFRDFVYCSMGGSGSPIYVKASGKPVFDANGEFRGYRGDRPDVTATIRAQEEHERLRQLEFDLAHMNRLSMMGELTATLAHEITQPIAAARNNARAALNFLDKQTPELGEVREALGCVVGDADRAGVIVDRIRDHIKKAPPRKHRFDLHEAINEVIVLAQSAIAENGVSVQTRLTEGRAPVEGDRVQLQQVILNLVLNAAEAMSAVDEGARELLISTEQDQHRRLCGSARFRAGHRAVASRARVRCILHHEVQRYGDGAVDLPVYHRRPWGPAVGRRKRAWRRRISVHLAQPGKELMNCLRAAHQNGEPHEDTARDASHQRACEGSKPPHRSERGPGRRHRDRPSRGLSESHTPF